MLINVSQIIDLTKTKQIFIHLYCYMVFYSYNSSYQLELKEEFLKRTEKLSENENRNKGKHLFLLCEIRPVRLRMDFHIIYITLFFQWKPLESKRSQI